MKEKVKKPFYKKWWVWVCAIVVVICIISGGSKPSDTKASVSASPSALPSAVASPSPSPTPSASKSPSGIKSEEFTAAINNFIDTFNGKDTGIGDISVKVTVSGSTALVDFYFSDLTAWSNSNETDRKELINTLGNSMDSAAAHNAYSTKDTVGVTTTLFSPSGLKLASRSVYGTVKLY
jgi:hypothetical protein